MKYTVRIYLVLCCAACVILGLMAWLNKRQLTGQLNALAHSHTEFLHQQEKLLRAISAAEEETKAGKEKLPGSKPKKPTELTDKERFDRRLVKFDAVDQQPEQRARSQRTFRRLFQKEYGDLYEELNLSPENLEKFKQLLVDKQLTYSDAAALVAAQGISSFSDTGRSVVQQTQDKVEEDIHKLLGDESYQAYQDYQGLRGTMVHMQNFEAALLERNVPLLDKARLRALATACSIVADEDRNPDYAAIAKDLGGATATQQILQRVNGQLTPEQVQAFIAFRDETIAAKKASEAFIRGEAPLPALQ